MPLLLSLLVLLTLVLLLLLDKPQGFGQLLRKNPSRLCAGTVGHRFVGRFHARTHNLVRVVTSDIVNVVRFLRGAVESIVIDITSAGKTVPKV